MPNKRASKDGQPSKVPPEYSRDAVGMGIDESRSITDVARSIGVNPGTLGNWSARHPSCAPIAASATS